MLTLPDFLADRNLLAIRISSSDLSGFFRKALTIPQNTSAMAQFADGSTALLHERQEVSGRFDLVLAKRGEVRLRLAFPDLPSSDGFPVAAQCTLVAALSLDRLEFFRDFCRTLFNFPGTCSAADLKSHLAREVRVLLATYVRERPGAELRQGDHAAPLMDLVKGALERHLFDAGVRFVRLADLTLASAEYDRKAASEKRHVEESQKAVRVMDKKEERLKRLASILKDQDVQGLLTKVPDERLKGLLYAKLMEDDAVQISAEELVSRAKDCGEEVVQVIYKAMETLLSNGASVAPEEIEPANAERIFAATGNRVLELDPAGAEPPRVHAFREPLRSVRTEETPRGTFLLGGSKRGVSVATLGGDGGVREYPLPGGRHVRGGVNSIAMDGERVYATHSEYGLASWPIEGDVPEQLHEEVTRAQKTTRGVQIHRGGLLFSSGPHVYTRAAGAHDLVKYVSSVESPVTCVAAAARTVFAGTENGSIVCWKADGPDQPVVLVRKREPIVTIRLAKICGIPHLIYGSRDLSVRARVIGQNLETSYESEGAAVGVLDAASDLICAADSDGRRIFLWKATAPAKPSQAIDVWKQSEKPVLDLWIKKARARGA